MKRVLLFLSIASLLPLAGRSDAVFSYEDIGRGCARITGRSGEGSDDVVIPSMIGGLTVTEIGDPTTGASTFKGDSMRSLTLPDTLREIRTYTFRGCTNLVSVNFGNGVTNIGGNAFYKCRSLKKLLIPASVNTLGAGVFANCSSLEKIVYLGNAPCALTDCYKGTSDQLVNSVCTGTSGWPTDGSTWPSGDYGRTTKIIAPTYTIMYLANGGTGTMSAQTCTYGRVYQLKSSSFTKNGKRSVGWISSVDNRRYDDGMLIFKLAWPGETVSLKAIFGN